MVNFYHLLLAPKRVIRIATIVLIVLILLNSLSLIVNILSILFWAYFFAYLLEPLVEWLEWKGIKRTFAIILIFLFLILLLGFSLMLIVPRGLAQVKDFIDQAPDLIKQFYEIGHGYLQRIQQINMPQRFMEELNNSIKHFESNVLQLLGNMTTQLGETVDRLVKALMVPVLSFYILRDKAKIDLQLYFLLPSSFRIPALGFMRRVDVVLGAWIRGQILVSLFIFTITLAALALVKMKYALLLAIFSGITNVIPYFGPLIGAIPGILLAGFHDPSLLWRVVLVYTMVQQIENSFVSPVIIGKRIGLPPAIIMISLLIGGQFGGVVGLIFAAPFAAIVNNLIEYLVDYRTRNIEIKNHYDKEL